MGFPSWKLISAAILTAIDKIVGVDIEIGECCIGFAQAGCIQGASSGENPRVLQLEESERAIHARVDG